MGSGTVFHSKDLGATKASEKKEYFTNVKKETRLEKKLKKVNLKKLDYKKINFKKIGIISGIILVSLACITLFILLAIKYAPPNKTLADAESLIISNPELGIETYNKLIFYAKSKEEKSSLYLNRAKALSMSYDNKYSSQILKDAYAAENLVKSKATALAVSLYEGLYGDETKAGEWKKVAETRKYSKDEVKDEDNI